MNCSKDIPIGRDKLGRFVYSGDLGWMPKDDRHIGSFIVDLRKSPIHSNYSRYFKDLGALKDILEYADQICKETKCYNCYLLCPFWGWNEQNNTNCLSEFKSWLVMSQSE